MTFPTKQSILVFKYFWVLYNYILSFALECYYFLSVVKRFLFVTITLWTGVDCDSVVCCVILYVKPDKLRSAPCFAIISFLSRFWFLQYLPSAGTLWHVPTHITQFKLGNITNSDSPWTPIVFCLLLRCSCSEWRVDIECVQVKVHIINYEDKRLICFSFGARDLSYRPVTTSSAQTRIIE